MTDKTTEPRNDNKPTVRMTFDELVEKSGLDEDTLLQRIASIMSGRDAGIDPL